MTQRACNQDKWARAQRRKSSRSNGGTSGECVEVLYEGGGFGIADTKLGDSSPIFDLPTGDFTGLLSGIKSGEID
ncbi:DUF397 domain-containing protein [Glycomyces buryatensis]|uniref:DUF397 domain-containing protein n=1 Tax=Glycomyces buryatensis TaxID=2570927 RepID=A0A4S8Q9Q8_9ACTN|nr:DUF397 domain-containing protein [Glycomyces buryatensis]THV39475.1 DUF397 domain-containing protein [Glycomyces buryatensis]